MASLSPDLEFIETFSPSTAEIDFLTEKINEESRAQKIPSDAYPFGIFVRKRRKLIPNERIVVDGTDVSSQPQPPTSINTPYGTAAVEDKEHIVGGCNGSIIYGSIYTDQLWVEQNYRGQGIGKLLMEKVHELARRKQCKFANVGTMDFQGAQSFYEKLGYEVEFVRGGYVNEGKMIYLKKNLI